MDEKLERKIAKLKNGDSSVFDYVYEHTNRPVYFAIFYILKDKMYAEDVLQDTYVRAISSIEQYKDGTNFVGWLCSIGKSLALNHLKKYKREVSTDFEEESYKYGLREKELPYIFDVAAKILERGRISNRNAMPGCRLQAARGGKQIEYPHRHGDLEKQRGTEKTQTVS